MTAETEHLRGLELASAGRIDEAEAVFRQLLEVDPSDAEALHFFGVLSFRRSRPVDAERHFRAALEARPGWAKAWHSLGGALQAQGKLEDAASACEKAVELDPDAAEFHYSLGLVFHALRRLPEAAEALRRATGAAPEFADGFSALGAVLRDMSLDIDAEAACQRAIEIDPGHAEAHNNLGNVRRRLGRPADAEAAYRRAIELRPDTGLFHGNLANLLRTQGKRAEAEAAYRRAVELDPAHTEAYRMLADQASITAGDPLFARMQEQLRADDLPLDRKMDLHFAMAKALEDQADYDAAFDHWQTGNRLKRSTLSYDDAVQEAEADRIIAVFDEELLSRHSGRGSPSDAPIFILGMPRSGTTLVEQILASHSQVTAGGELTALRRLAHETDYPQAIAGYGAAELAGLGVAYLNRARPADSRHFTDKLPDNFYRIGLIRVILPNARIVHCRRDPVDTCLACYRRHFTRGNLGFAYDLRELGLAYNRYLRLMDHWRTVAPGAFHELHYEDMIADQEGETRRLLEFCGLPFEDACLRFHETERTVQTASADQVRQKIYDSAVKRWKHYERHLAPLLEILNR